MVNLLPSCSPHPKQKKGLFASWQLTLLHARPKIECLFDYLKEHPLLLTSFPRSVNGYAIHYFADGNGRTARMIYALLTKGYDGTPESQEYYSSLRQETAGSNIVDLDPTARTPWKLRCITGTQARNL